MSLTFGRFLYLPKVFERIPDLLSETLPKVKKPSEGKSTLPPPELAPKQRNFGQVKAVKSSEEHGNLSFRI